MHVYKIVPSCKAIHAKKEALAEEDYDGYNVNEEKIIHALAILWLLLLLLLSLLLLFRGRNAAKSKPNQVILNRIFILCRIASFSNIA